MAPLLSASLESASASSPFSPRSTGSASNRQAVAHRPSGKVATHQRFSHPARNQSAEIPELDLIWGSLIESLQQGVLVVSRSFRPIYGNLRSKELCKGLSGVPLSLQLPGEVSKACHRLVRENCTSNQLLVMECQSATGRTIRISVRWLHLNSIGASSLAAVSDQTDEHQQKQQDEQSPYIMVLLEDCHEVLREELRIEQQKYDLTEREAEVWMLLRQEYTYQEIAKMLQISLNTVKTHVKNVYAKRRSYQGQEKLWNCE